MQCHRFVPAMTSSDYKSLLLQFRPSIWLPGANSSPCLNDSWFCERLLDDMSLCLTSSALQVAFVSTEQHLMFVDPEAQLAPPLHESDVMAISADDPNHRCCIRPFSLQALWWSCLEEELFYWPDSTGAAPSTVRRPVRRCKGVLGFKGSEEAFHLPGDVAAVLALNAAWYTCPVDPPALDHCFTSTDRKLQAIFLLRDGRFVLVGTSELRGSLDVRTECQVCSCIVAGSLLELVAFGQDDYSRDVLKTRLPGQQSPDLIEVVNSVHPQHSWSKAMRHIFIPELETCNEQRKLLGVFLTAEGLQSDQPALFDSADIDNERNRFIPRDFVQVQHTRLEIQSESFELSQALEEK